MTVRGLSKVLKDLDKFGKEADKGIDTITKVKSVDIAADAKALAPKNNGKLAQSIITTKVEKADYKVIVNSSYGAYVEFGTGAKVKVPAELSAMAAQFKGKKAGSFNEGLRAIKDWCRNKGIEESAAYPIFMSILKKGQEPQPFLYPAFVKGRKQYVNDLKHLLETLTKKV
jgi:HK97 gp10 family phage protein